MEYSRDAIFIICFYMKNIKLFDYQEDMKERIEKALRLHRSVMVQMPTGTGKTVLLASVVESFLREHSNCNVWIVAHRRELVSQIRETIQRVFSKITPSLFTLKEGSTSHPDPLTLRGEGGNRPTRCSEPLRSKVGGPSKVSPDCAGWDRLGATCLRAADGLTATCLRPTEGLGDRLGERGGDGLGATSASSVNPTSDMMPIKAVSIQWLSKHYDEIEEEPGMIVIDEAHHALAKTYKEMWERFPNAKFLGLTATPCRLNGKGFTDLFDVLVQSWSVPEFISKGRLATYDFVSIKSDGVTQRLIDSLQKRGADGDYQNKEMDMLLNKKPSIERLYQSLEEFGKDRKGIVYAINISHAQKITKLYQEHGVKAIAIDSKTPATERQQDIEAFKKGDIQVLVNVDIFSEGFDCPDVEFVQLARPTLSLAKYLQMVGRGLRVAKGKKNCVIIDNVGLYRVFGLPSQVWNWNAMFEGKLKVGKRKETPKDREFFLKNEKQDDIQIHPDSEMMMVMSHEELLQRIQYREFVDSKGEFAIIKLPDGKMTVVNRQGEQVIEPGNYYDMKFLQGNILSYRPRRKTVCYYDLLARVVIDEDIHAKDAPEVITINKWEFVEYNGLFRSRTYEYFALPFRPSQYDLWNYGYYLIYNFRRSTASGCQEWIYKEEDGGSMRMHKENSEKVCFLRGDHTHVYWLCADLYDSGIVVMDSHEDYYYVDSSLKKQEEQELLLMKEKTEAGHVELYQTGRKWGVKVDGKVIVPPLYHSIAQPVGAYCAFEQIPRHWGVMTVKGKVIVDAKYEKVEVRDGGIAVVPDITGKTQTIHLK